ncbi:molybdopterin cofactor-binding domain-containing protein [Lonsdalea populi]|uniref:molybdopterin cofactor-binding domain-containing protein n=1 Tax=Lonsdalea populi TaxID=1172565 RepID=UPI000A1E679A|nr:molybdopterin cofactor-binding domain-containing protein [Lonsdalea populi]OSM95679.1 aldehyde oxidase [Lonsdalea populi]QPQ23142.1 molybdopterin-dependent oxidoreductase [Lonsdalea populi]RAT41688.1 aldehyde oxidase [Lonsdalea populi]RAT42256.1 aldehyde oxidase [Lonsdalea populi]RAT56639.1 aldehyde oxidase [Lonsdalea populi]
MTEVKNRPDRRVIGREAPRVDGLGKVKGSAVYGDDIVMKDMLYGVCRYADIAAGRVEAVDLDAALAVPGVVKIATWRDVPGESHIGVVMADYPPLVKDNIAFRGDVIAAIAAETYEAACLAADKIRVRYTPYAPITRVEEALKPDARPIHPGSAGNVINRHHTIKGDIEAGFAAASHIFEREYEVGYQEHAYIEPESIIAWIDDNEQIMTLSGSVQNAHRVRGFVAKYLGLPQSRVNVKRAVLGGSFGGKDDIIDHLACRAALLSHLTGRPVKFTYNREQSMRESYKRHPYKMKYKIGLDDEARIQAIKIDVLADGGSYAGQTPFVTWRSAVQAAGPYRIPNVRVEVTGVYTNNNYTSAFRGFGAPQVILANESLMDEVAAALGLSPLELRRRNILQQGDTSMAGQVFSEHTVSAGEVLSKAADDIDFSEKRERYRRLNAEGGPIKYGIGLALSHRGCSLGAEGLDASSALIQINADGSVNISTAVSENGQGLQTVMSMIAAEAFGLPLSWIMFTDPATAMIADGGSTVASRGTLMGGQAVLNAADKLKQRMAAAIGVSLGASGVDELIWRDGKVFNRADPRRGMDFRQAVTLTKAAGANLSAYGWHVAPSIHWDEEKGCGSPYFTWVYGCQAAEVAVDTRTGKITLLAVTAVHDVGAVINRVGFEGQVYGGVVQGMIGYGMLEDLNVENGEVKSENFDTYLLPTIRDIPNINVIAVENPDKAGPYGAKVIGEPVLELGGAALNNAVSFALGRWNRTLPLTLEQVRLGYNLKKPARQSEVQGHDGAQKQVLRLNTLQVSRPSSMGQALALLAQEGAQALAGGTDVLVQARQKTTPARLVDISGLRELRGITEEGEGVSIGAGTCFTDLTSDARLMRDYPLLVTACRTIGSLQLRNRATVGGNIVNAAPCADSVPPLMIYRAEVELRSAAASRRVPLDAFITGGYRTQLRAGELVTRIILPPPPTGELRPSYLQLGRRAAVNITRQSLTALFRLEAGGHIELCRLVDGAVFGKPQRLTAVEQALVGHAPTPAVIDRAAAALETMMTQAIGGRWSAPYKIPVYLDMFRQVMTELAAQE